MKVGYILELMLAVAVGLALALGWMEERWVGEEKWWDIAVWSYANPALSFLSGVILVEAVGLWIEKARRRGPRPWGIGRLMWSTLGVACLCDWAWLLTTFFLRNRFRSRWPHPPIELSWNLVWLYSARFPDALGLVPLALFIITRLAGLPRDPRPDGREWAGRSFGILVLLVYLFAIIKHLHIFEMIKPI